MLPSYITPAAFTAAYVSACLSVAVRLSGKRLIFAFGRFANNMGKWSLPRMNSDMDGFFGVKTKAWSTCFHTHIKSRKTKLEVGGQLKVGWSVRLFFVALTAAFHED